MIVMMLGPASTILRQLQTAGGVSNIGLGLTTLQGSNSTSLPRAPSSSQADSVSADAISVSTENFQPSATSTPKGKKRRPHKRKVPVHLMKWRLQQKKSKGEEKSGPSTSSSTLESNLKNSVLDVTSDFATIVPPIPSIGLQPALNHEIDTTSMRNSGVSYMESNVCDTLLTRYVIISTYN
ncbi:uncharacterized protein LOC120350259 [Nilaparvata lugens]|uniref:uncharacterized protein LOC120350259 n=1 Tax=Nilaparvata lugens TaxID=108931 RepID=UPI00193D05B1|nr:uncharacterized protein LOC120350259 [Nilaparvata lugens]